MTDEKLAEKVAEKLGWDHSPSKKGSLDHWKKDIKKCDYFRSEYLQTEIFSWPTFGLMIEKAESMNYCIRVWDTTISFILDCAQDKRDRLPTYAYSWKEHGHIKACALAFVEINKEVK